jgi:catechol 2,3-dioxygenase
MTVFAPNLSHMGVFTSQLDAMRSFYVSLLGMAVSDTGVGRHFRRRLVFMTGDPTQHHQLVLVGREEGDPQGGAMFQLSFKVQSLDEIRLLERRARAQDCADLRAINHGNSWSLYFRDPDGNMVEVYMDTGWYVPQPFADPLALDLDDGAIRRATDARIAEIGNARPMAQWSADMALHLAQTRIMPED